jgi:hypothetical protein
VPWNLQVLPADINLSKGNRYDNLAWKLTAWGSVTGWPTC